MIKEKFSKLIDVKSIVTITLVVTLVIIILAQLNIQDNIFQLFSSAVMLVLGFFFGKKDSGGDVK
jgi:small-conductance mechanosensitive channel